MKANTYIAGHTGLVGSAIMRRLQQQPGQALLTARSKELDLRRQEPTEAFFREHRIDRVYLAAAKVGGIMANSTYPAEFIYDNLAIAMNVVHAAYKSGVKKLLNLGSSCIYPKLAPQPMTEAALLTSALEPTNEAYAIAKIAALKLCRYYNEQYGTNYISVMPTNLYGPGDNYNLETGHVLPSMMRKFHLAKLLAAGDMAAIKKDILKNPLGAGLDKKIDLDDAGSIQDVLGELGLSKKAVKLWGTGSVYREFLYVDDMADACVYLMENCDYKDIGEVINIGTGQDLQLKELAEMIRKVVGFNGSIDYDKKHPDGTPKKLLDVSRATALGWKPKIGLRDGIELEYHRYIQQK